MKRLKGFLFNLQKKIIFRDNLKSNLREAVKVEQLNCPTDGMEGILFPTSTASQKHSTGGQGFLLFRLSPCTEQISAGLRASKAGPEMREVKVFTALTLQESDRDVESDYPALSSYRVQYSREYLSKFCFSLD